MSTQLKLRRGTTAQHSTFTGASGEVTVDTTKKTLVVHDGTTAGGVPLQKETFQQTGTGSTIRTVDAKLKEWVSPQDFGAVADGVADDTTAVALALSSGKPVCMVGTYLVTTVAVSSVNNISVDASRATFNTTRASAFRFDGCNDLYWRGGVINPGSDLTGLTAGNRWPFFVTNCSRAVTDGLTINCQPTYAYAPLTYWNVNRGVITNCHIHKGGDNSIWCFYGNDITITGNVIYANERGRSITMQQVNGFAVTGNTIKDGKGDGISIHGSSNGTVTGNLIHNMAVDSVILSASRGISIEVDENATTTTIAAAAASPYLYNGVFVRNVTVSGNTISNCQISVQVGGGIIAGGYYGNQGVVEIVGNTFANNVQGINILAGTKQLSIVDNVFQTMQQGGVIVSLDAGSGGYTTTDLYVRGNRFSNTNAQALGYTSVHFTGSGYSLSRNIVVTDNTFDAISGVASWTNLALGTVGLRSDGNKVLDGAATVEYESAVQVQAAFSDQSGSSALSGFMATGQSHQFTQAGSVGDTFTTVLSIPSNASVIANVMIGSYDRVMQVGTIYAHNGSTPAFSFTGIGAGYAQLSGGNLQLKGYTSGGAASYGGVYSIRYTILKTA